MFDRNRAKTRRNIFQDVFGRAKRRKKNANHTRLAFEPLEGRLLLAADFGDAPAPYPTLAIDDGPSHEIVWTEPLMLGSTSSSESDGTQSATASADGGDDGVTFGTLSAGQLDAPITVDVSGVIGDEAKVDMWIDWNADGSWGGPEEHVAKNVSVVDGANVIEIDVPSWATPTDTFARVRLSTAGNHGIIGSAADGEVEDYAVTIASAIVGTLEFESARVVSTTNFMWGLQNDVAVADLDGDGDNDMFFLENELSFSWAENDGIGNFSLQTIDDSPPLLAFNAVAADMDKDSDLDLIHAGTGFPTVYFNDGEENFTMEVYSFVFGDYLYETHAIDIDYDGNMDLAVNTHEYDTPVLGEVHIDKIIAVQSDLSTDTGELPIWYYGDNAYPADPDFDEWRDGGLSANGGESFHPADIDNDGDLDFVASLGYDLVWLESTAEDEEFLWPELHYISQGSDLSKVLTADVNLDGDIDIIAATADGLEYHENNGDGTFVHGVIWDSTIDGNFAANLYLADMNGDGALDILAAYEDSGKLHYFENRLDAMQGEDKTLFLPGFSLSTNDFSPTSVTAADMDGDGILDVVAMDEDQVLWYRQVPMEVTNNAVSVVEGQVATNDGTLVDGSIVEASIGSVTDNGDGTWSWSFDTSDGPDESQVVTITATDGGGHETLLDFTLTVSNVAPTIALSGASTVDEGSTYTLTLGAVTDPGPDTVTSYVVNWGDGNTSTYPTAGDVTHTYTDGDHSRTISVDLVDEDATHQDAGTLSLTVNNVAPSIATDNATVTVYQFEAATNSGTFADAGDDDTVSLSATIGTVTDNGDGTWGWSFDTSAGPVDSELVIITATDNDGAQATASFDLTVAAADHGDAPAPYPTTLAEGGASHSPVGARLGSTVDGEAAGIHSANADADGADEDGVVFGELLVGQLGGTVTVDVQGEAGKLDAWIDFNGDGSWNGDVDQIADNLDLAVGTHELHFDVPSWAVIGTTFARFRISSVGDLNPGGSVDDGEVEDYAVVIEEPAAATGLGLQQIIRSNATDAIKAIAVDVDSDGDMDVVSIGNYSGLYWHENDGDANFTSHQVKQYFRSFLDVYATDIDRDGDMDIFFSTYANPLEPETITVAWLENDGNQSFTEHEITSVESYAFQAADVDNDGDLDLLAQQDDQIVVLKNNGIQSFSETSTITVGNNLLALAVVDMDRDGDVDVLGKGMWFENDGSGTFSQSHIYGTGLGAVDAIHPVDVNGDGHMDVVTASVSNAKIAWHENDGSQSFTTHVLNTGDPQLVDVFAQDIDGDGDVDIVSSARGDDAVRLFENDGDENFSVTTIATEDGVNSVYLADLDGDQDLDVLTAAYDAETIAWYPVGLQVTTDSGSITVFEGQTANSSGTYAIGDAVAFTASIGSVIDNGDGTWSWSFDTSDGPAESQTVGITATTATQQTTKTFELTVKNVAPTLDVDAAYLASQAAMIGDIVSNVNHVFQTVTFAEPFPVTPVVIPIGGAEDGSPVGIRIRNVTTTGFEIAQLDAPRSGANGVTTATTVRYLAVLPGTTELDGLTIEAGFHDTQTTRGGTSGFDSNGSLDSIEFVTDFASTPTLLSAVQTMNNETSIIGDNSTPAVSSSWLQTAVDNVDGDGFQTALERAEVADGGTDIDSGITADETIGWVAISAGTGSLVDDSGSTILYESAPVDNFAHKAAGNYSSWDLLDTNGHFFDQTFSSAPLVVASQMSVVEENGSWARHYFTADQAFVGYVQEDKYSDGEVSHEEETLGIFAFSGAFVASSADSVAAIDIALGGTASISGTFADVGADGVSLSASVGSVTDQGGGAWQWDLTNAVITDFGEVTITATDNDGAESNVRFSLNRVNTPPAIDSTNNAVAFNEGQTATNDGTFSDDAPDVVLSASVGVVTDNGDGTWEWSLLTTDGPGVDNITITATDSDGASTAITFDLIVNNVAPTLTLSGDASVNEGSTYTLGLSSNDPGADTITEWEISWGDGAVQTVAGGSASVDHTYADGPNSYTISATATDEDGTHAAGNTVAVTVNNVAPTLMADPAAVVIDEGGSASKSFTTSDVPADTINISTSIGTIDSNGSGSWTWIYNGADDLATTPVTFTAIDDDGGSTRVSFDLTVDNVAPTAMFSNGGPITYGESVSVTFSDQFDVAADDTAGFHYAYATSVDGFAGVEYASGSVTDSTHAFTGLEAGNGQTLYGRIIDKDNGYTQHTTLVDIAKADATVEVNGYTGVYDAAAHGASGTATGVGGVNLGGSLTLGDSFTNVSGGTANWTFSGGTNYLDESGSVAIDITKADATVAVNDYTGTYDASAHTASVTITGVGGVELATDSISRTDAGQDSVTASTSATSDPNYNAASGTATIDIAKADATVVVNGYTGVYDAAAHGASGTAKGVGDVDLSGSLTLGDIFTDVPGGTANWSFSGGTNYLDESGDVAIDITDPGNTAPLIDGLGLAAVIDETANDGSPALRTADLSGTGDSAVIGQDVILTGTFADADLSDTHEITVDWGDGQVDVFNVADVDLNDDGRSFELRHAYQSEGSFVVDVTIDDGVSTDVQNIGADVQRTAMQGRVLAIAGSDGDDRIKARRKSGDVLQTTIRQRGGDTTVVDAALADVDELLVLGRGGDDYIAISHALSLNTVLSGGTGHDMIFGGSGIDKILGGDGDDRLFGRAGNDVVVGGTGDDRMWGNHGNDYLNGGAGNDRIAGGNGEDTVTGGADHDLIWGQNQNDLIYGNDGNDRLFGGNGDDTIHGNAGDDMLSGDNGSDVLDGGAGNDIIHGGNGSDMLIGDDGNDILFGGAGNDTIDGGNGDDLIFGGPGSDDIEGGEGFDNIFDRWRWTRE